MIYFIEIDGISVKIVKKRNAKNLILHWKENNVYLTTPYFCSKKKITDFLVRNIEKIKFPKTSSYPKINEEEILRLQKILQNKIEIFSKLMHLPTYPFYIKDVKSFWGKCFITKKYLVFNSALVNFDDKIIESIVVHELAHFFYNNHSDNFYKLVTRFCPDYKLRIKTLKKVSL